MCTLHANYRLFLMLRSILDTGQINLIMLSLKGLSSGAGYWISGPLGATFGAGLPLKRNKELFKTFLYQNDKLFKNVVFNSLVA